MRIDELSWTEKKGWSQTNSSGVRNGHAHNGRLRNGNGGAYKTDLALYFGTRETLANSARYDELRIMFPDAHVVGCSTGGQIHNDVISDNEISVATLSFDATTIRLACEPAFMPEQSHQMWRGIRQYFGRGRSGRHICSVGRTERQWQRTRGGHHERRRSAYL